MVLQIPIPDGRSVFVTSSLRDEQAESEIVDWASAHGFPSPPADQVFTLYTAEHLAREWRLLERVPA